MWSKFSCLRKQHDGRDEAANHSLNHDLKFNTLATTPLPPRKNVTVNHDLFYLA